MSDQQKIYAPIRAKVFEFKKSGKKILKVSFSAEKMIAFIEQHKNDRGYVNLGVSRRNEVGKFGETHTVWLDTWNPNSDQGNQGAGNRQNPAPQPEPPMADNQPSAVDEGEVPF